ncbi:mechanosensitive ion channel domain-containing protein [Sulfurovum sp.]|uniref:mechanosensitive ion channel family protein n=1 Tax=Sulfurovum sp. TaxID=1969726 RepID=UPI0025F0DC7E|nr:mechanosensitive ion channel domain-containing protein [Sulfurovum sp.]
MPFHLSATKIKLFLITLFLLLVHAHAADINSTLVAADKALYTDLLKKFRQSDTQNEQVLLQEALLQKLISFPVTVSRKEQVFSLPKDQKEAKHLLLQWFELLDEKSKFQQQQSSIQDKMVTLKNQIKSTQSKDAVLLTFQLQYALYDKNDKLIDKQIKLLKDQQEQIQTILFQIPKILMLNQQALFVTHQNTLNKLTLEKKKLKTLQIKKERLELLGNTEEINAFTKKISTEKERYRQISQDMLATDFLMFCDAMQKKDQSAFKWEHDILQQNMVGTQHNALQELLKKMEREYLGMIHTLGGTTVQQVEDTAHSVWTLLSNPLFEINNTPVSILKLITVFFIFIFGFLFGGLFKHSILKPKDSDSDIDSDAHTSSRMLLSNIGYYLILIIAFFSALKVLGLNLSSLAVVAGALSVGIGFGLQNIVSNFVSGLILMFERSIKIGDYIQLDETLRGRVTDIRMRSTTIKTNANIDVIIPNQNFIQNNVVNWTMEDNIRRFEIPFGVRYGTDPQQVIDVILKALKESGFTDIYTSRTRYPRVVMTEIGDSSINFELFVWVIGKGILYPKRTRSRFLILIYNALNAHNIEIPFPQRDLHIRSIEEGISFATTNKDTIPK